MFRFLLVHPIGRRSAAGLALVLTILGATVPPAHASAPLTTTRSCVDGGGITWHTRVLWGGTYVAASGATKVSVDDASWTTTLGAVPTDSTVRSYSGAGELLQTLYRTATVDYRQGTVSGARNPLNPPSGGAAISITVGRDGDGFAGCTVSHSQSATADPIVAVVGDLACAAEAAVTTSTCQQRVVSDSIITAKPAALLTLGDNQYNEGTLPQFQTAYETSYGRLKAITSPAAGNHEYNTTSATGYFDYFGTAAGERSKGYYSRDIGAWHVVTLNSERDITASGAQLRWLKDDLAAHQNACTLAVLHKPRFSSGAHGSNVAMKPFIDTLVAARADLVLAGHDHHYERFAAQTGSGAASNAGITQVIAGTGGKSLYQTTAVTNSISRSSAGFGWVKLALRRTSVDLRFVPVGANTFSDALTITCR